MLHRILTFIKRPVAVPTYSTPVALRSEDNSPKRIMLIKPAITGEFPSDLWADIFKHIKCTKQTYKNLALISRSVYSQFLKHCNFSLVQKNLLISVCRHGNIINHIIVILCRKF